MSILYAEKGVLERDGSAVVLRQDETLTHFPVGTTAVVMLMPGTTVTHQAVRLCADSGTLLLWTGEHGVRLYSAGQPGGATAEKLLAQAAVRLSDRRRLASAGRIYREMFGEAAPANRSIEQLRGFEGNKVKQLYVSLAATAGVPWNGRNATATAEKDAVNHAISTATAALYGVTEAAILALGYSPAIGIIHSGDPRSFVYDVADCVKFKTVVPLAMETARDPSDIEGRTRRSCRDLFAKEKLLDRLVELAENIIDAGQTGRA